MAFKISYEPVCSLQALDFEDLSVANDMVLTLPTPCIYRGIIVAIFDS